MQDIEACIEGIEYYLRNDTISAHESAQIAQRWLEHIEFANWTPGAQALLHSQWQLHQGVIPYPRLWVPKDLLIVGQMDKVLVPRWFRHRAFVPLGIGSV